MALEAITGSAYTAAAAGKIKAESTAAQEIGTSNLNITEVSTNGRASGSSQSGKDSGQKDVITNQQIKDAISKANSHLKAQRTRCEFSYNEETKSVSIKVLDEDTKEVIKEIPPEQTLEMVEKMWELAGLLVDEKR